MRHALAIPALSDVEWRVDAGRWSAFHRARLFLSTMASPTDIAFPPPRPLPWEDGWSPWASTP
eukprot:3087915-Alexandrium_andersonii.AAC.1